MDVNWRLDYNIKVGADVTVPVFTHVTIENYSFTVYDDAGGNLFKVISKQMWHIGCRLRRFRCNISSFGIAGLIYS